MGHFDEVTIVPARKSKKDELWLMSYADLVTNLMAIFIMMLAISKVDMQKFEAISSNMAQIQQENTLDQLKQQLDAEIKKRNLASKVNTSLDLNGLNVEFLTGVLFDSGRATLSEKSSLEARPIMEILSKTDKKYKLSFEGHTDDLPFRKNSEFRDNWDLSSARGSALLTEMKNLGLPEDRMNVGGYAHTRPKVDIKGKTGEALEAARAANRRVVIRVFQ
jgi:chemotaxis protein MotB